MNAIEETYQNARSQAVIALGSTIPGYWFTVTFVDILGRLKITYLGFGMMTCFMGACCGAYFTLLSPNNADNTVISSNQPTNRNGWITMYVRLVFLLRQPTSVPTPPRSSCRPNCSPPAGSPLLMGSALLWARLVPSSVPTGSCTPPTLHQVRAVGSFLPGPIPSTAWLTQWLAGYCKQKNNCPTGRTQVSSTIGASCDLCTPLVKCCYPYGLGVQGAGRSRHPHGDQLPEHAVHLLHPRD